MINKILPVLLLIFASSSLIFSQEEEQKEEIDILRPSKAAFYSAVIPGLGQIYNNKAWKVPIVYAAIGVSTWHTISMKNSGHTEMHIKEEKLAYRRWYREL